MAEYSRINDKPEPEPFDIFLSGGAGVREY